MIYFTLALVLLLAIPFTIWSGVSFALTLRTIPGLLVLTITAMLIFVMCAAVVAMALAGMLAVGMAVAGA